MEIKWHHCIVIAFLNREKFFQFVFFFKRSFLGLRLSELSNLFFSSFKSINKFIIQISFFFITAYELSMTTLPSLIERISLPNKTIPTSKV